MFPQWFVCLFNILFYGVLPFVLIYGIIDTAKETKYALENPVEYEEDFEEEEI